MTRRRANAAAWAGALLVLLVAAVAWRHFDLGTLLSLGQLKASREALAAEVAARPLAAAAAFFALYVAVAALSIPGTAVLTLAAGALFGLGGGLLLVSFASSLGALLAFLAARHLLRDALQARFGRTLQPVEAGVRRSGSAYLLTLRLVPVFPFGAINLLMGLTPMPAARFYAVSQLGMLPGTAAYANAGTQLATLRSPADVLSPGVLASLVLLGLLPLLAMAAVRWIDRRRLHAGWPRPRRFDRNLVVIGAGSGGLVAASLAAALKARVTLVEAGRMGGDCLNTGCVPSKALIRSAKAMHELRRAHGFGIAGAHGEVDFAAVMRRVRQVIAQVAPHDSVERYSGLGVEVLQGHARLSGPWSVEVTAADGTTRTLTTKNIVIATGARPVVPPLPGLHEADCLTSDSVWTLKALPQRLLVLGGGPVGCELAQAFVRLGSRVTQVERAPRILTREDAEAAEQVAAALRADGVQLLTAHEALRVETVDGERRLVVRHAGAERAIAFDELLCAVGRSPRVSGFGLEELGIVPTPQGTLEADAYQQTRFPNIYAVGDVAGPQAFTHAAAHQAAQAVLNALFGRWRRFRADRQAMPRTTFTSPELACIGLTEAEARAQGTPFELTRYGLDQLDRALTDGHAQGFVKVLTEPGRGRILGATIVGERAGEMLAEFVLAMHHGLGLGQILGTVHAYPTLAEASQRTAGAWRRAHAPARLLGWLARYHAWERK